jgi:hypothetical protein
VCAAPREIDLSAVQHEGIIIFGGPVLCARNLVCMGFFLLPRSREDGCFIQCARTAKALKILLLYGCVAIAVREKSSAVCGSLEHQTQHTQSHALAHSIKAAVLWVSLSHYDPPGRTALEKSARPGQRAASLASASSRGVLYRAGPVWAKQAAITARACGRGNLSSRFYWPVVVTLLAK